MDTYNVGDVEEIFLIVIRGMLSDSKFKFTRMELFNEISLSMDEYRKQCEENK